MKPVIAMPKLGNDPFRIYMKSKYVLSLWRTGAAVRWIPLDGSAESLAALLECDGLLMPGGVDIEPARYGQQKTEQCGKTDPARDAGEWRVLETFLPTGKPVLCICRGIQMLNVFQGGTLHQHIPGHSDFKTRGTGCHKVNLVSGSKLDQIFQVNQLTVNSLHHQAVDTLGKDLSVCAISEDGIVEAVVHTKHPFCLGVQWHPEHLFRRISLQRKLFQAFVEACK